MAELPAEIAALVLAHGLPGEFRVSECFVDRTEFGGLALDVVGLIASAPDGRSVSGSAGEQGRVPYDRAFFELFERAAVLEAERRAPRLLPVAPDGADYAYSRSNGVAAGRDYVAACRAARAELVERDRLLRAWYGETAPRRGALPEDAALAALGPCYEFEAYLFPSVADAQTGIEVVGVFGFPKNDEAPFIYGSAADVRVERATARALAEALQRWAFLWGETIPDSAPEFAKAADYHQELYLWPAMHERVRAWLGGAHRERAPALEPRVAGDALPEFVELWASAGLFVARAVPRAELPLVFGRGHPNAPRHEQEPFLVHPIS